MNQRPPTISDADIHALIDGELDEPRKSEVEAAIIANETVLERTRQYQLLNAGLFENTRKGEDKPVPDRLLHAALGHHRRPLSYARAAGLLVAGILVGSLTTLATQSWKSDARMLSTVTTDLVEPAAVAHAIYSPEVKHPVEVTADQEAHLVAWLSKRLRSKLKAPELSSEGFALVGGRLLPSSDDLAAQFMYENEQAQRITLYIRQGLWENSQSAFRYTESGDSGIFYWIDGSMGYALAGNLPKQNLLQLAEIVYHQLESDQ